MLKRGQVTIFLIVGIIILGLFSGVFYLVSTLQQKDLLVSEETATDALGVKPRITSFVESCIREVATPGIYLLGIQGGIINLEDPTKSLITENGIINYGYLNGENLLSAEKMEAQLNVYIEEELPLCLDNFSSFSPEINIEVGEFKPEIKVYDNEIVINLNYEISAVKGNEEIKIDAFSESIPVHLGEIIIETEKIITNHKNNPTLLNLKPAEDIDYFISVFPYSSDTWIYSISDESSVIDGAPFAFIFAIKDNTLNSAPDLGFIPDITIRKGMLLSYQLSATDQDEDYLSFYSDNPLFPVNEEGFINVTIYSPEIYVVLFGVKDPNDLKDEQQVRITVVEDD